MEETEFTVDVELRDNYRFGVDFDMDWVPVLQMDEGWPLGRGEGPDAKRLLAAAVANCMSASLLFCLRRARIEVPELRTQVRGTLARNDRGRLRIGGLEVTIQPVLTPEDAARAGRCMELFQDFCVVGESVREGIPIEVRVQIEESAGTAAPAGAAGG
jgi:organic hydroperoxide reductase OsmC/OhrA